MTSLLSVTGRSKKETQACCTACSVGIKSRRKITHEACDAGRVALQSGTGLVRIAGSNKLSHLDGCRPLCLRARGCNKGTQNQQESLCPGLRWLARVEVTFKLENSKSADIRACFPLPVHGVSGRHSGFELGGRLWLPAD